MEPADEPKALPGLQKHHSKQASGAAEGRSLLPAWRRAQVS
jgi:hypothetical protein